MQVLSTPVPVLPALAAYSDPLDRVWLALWRRLGIEVARTPAVYASSDGRGGLHIGTRETLDPDDCLAQMLLHELCHALVEGPSSFRQADWGLDNTDERHVPHEQAALRLQAHLLGRHGLQRRLAPTTEFRPYYDALGPEPLLARSPGDEAAVQLAVVGMDRAGQAPVGPWLDQALRTTRLILEAADGFELVTHAPDRLPSRT